MTKPLLAALAAALLACAQPAAARAASPPPAPGYVLPETETWEIAGPDGYPYQIFVSRPQGPPPAHGYPVLYVLDGNAMFAGFAETRRILGVTTPEASKAIVVGVGYKTDKPYDHRRLYDFTAGTPPLPWRDQLGSTPTGGWNAFLDFLTGKLRGEVARRYPINLDRQALFGHSLGGLFALHALFTRPAGFHAIIAASPSLFWQDTEMQKEERDFAARLRAGQVPNPSHLMVVWGELEETPLERWDAEAFVKRMEPLSAYGLRTRSEQFAGETHITVPIRSVPAALRFACVWP